MNKAQQPTMYIQNSSKFPDFNRDSPLQNCNGLISLKLAIAHFAYISPLQTSELI